MEADRAVLETLARCVSLLVYYRNSGRTAQAREVLEADVAVVAAWVEEAGLSREELGRRILSPLLAQLHDRYTSGEALDLYEAFLAASNATGSMPSPSGENLVYRG
jgi:hypothetical protein